LAELLLFKARAWRIAIANASPITSIDVELAVGRD